MRRPQRLYVPPVNVTVDHRGTCFTSATIDPATLLIGKGSTMVLADSAPASAGKTVLVGDLFSASFIGLGGFSETYTSTNGACSETGTFSLVQFTT